MERGLVFHEFVVVTITRVSYSEVEIVTSVPASSTVISYGY